MPVAIVLLLLALVLPGGRYGIELNGDHNVVTNLLTSQTINGGINVTGAGNTIGGTGGAGNIIHRSGSSGIWLRSPSASGNVVQGNVVSGHHSSGITLQNGPSGEGPSGNLIGGTAPGAGNVIFGNGHTSGEGSASGANVSLAGSNNVVQGNRIRVNESGEPNAGSVRTGVVVSGTGHTVGGTEPGAGNVIADHPVGIRVTGSNIVVQGNRIGADASGTQPLPNQVGIQVWDRNFEGAPSDITIGGTAPGAGNVVAFNKGNGVTVSALGEPPTGITISRNAIFANQGLGIDLAPGGVTPNDPGDGDIGTNNLQNFPVITSITEESDSTIVAGRIDTPSPETVTIELFSSQVADASGFGEGRVFQATATPDSAGNFTAVLPGGLTGKYVTATATDAAGNTSEFSRARLVGNQPPVAVASATPDQGIAPLEVTFSSQGSHDPDGTIVSRQWDFGDGTASTVPDPTHTYNEPGTYTASLTVVDNEGSVGTDTVTVDPDPATVLRSADIDLQAKEHKGRILVTGEVTVVDGSGSSEKDVTVLVTWTLPDGSSADQTASTKGNGAARFEIEGGSGTYTLTVTRLAKPGHTFDPENSVLEARITR